MNNTMSISGTRDRKPLVSIVTPCFNGEKYLDRYFAQVVGQSYPNIELLFVDDGSTDDTYRIANGYHDCIQAKGYRYKLLRQSNGGQASAMNLGLQYVSGKYLAWTDVDDIMHSNCIEKKVTYLENNPGIDMVCTEVDIVSEDDLSVVSATRSFSPAARMNVFEAILFECGGYCTNIAYLVRTNALFDSLSGRRIYESRAGQNWQMLLPLAYKQRCGFIDESLATVVLTSDSHSRSKRSAAQRLQRSYDLEDVLRHSLATIRMSEDDRKRYEKYLDEKYLQDRFGLAIELGNREQVHALKRQLDNCYGKSLKRDIVESIGVTWFGRNAYRLLHDK